MTSSASYEIFATQLAALGKQRAAAAATAIIPGARPQPAIAAFWNPGDKEGCKKLLKGSLIKTTTGGRAEFSFTRGDAQAVEFPKSGQQVRLRMSDDGGSTFKEPLGAAIVGADTWIIPGCMTMPEGKGAGAKLIKVMGVAATLTPEPGDRNAVYPSCT
jgi:hypothetical protein